MRRLATAACVVALAAMAAAAPAQGFGLKEFSFDFTNEDGSPTTQAGSHPFQASATFNVQTKPDPEIGETPDGDVKALRFQLPPGFIGSLVAVPRCDTADFLAVDGDGYPSCPNATAVGATQAQIQNPGEPLSSPVYNLVPPPGVAVKIGFIVNSIPVTVENGINKEEPHNVVAGLLNVPQVVEFFGSSLQLWGIPASHSHDPFRGHCLSNTPVDEYGEMTSKGTCDTGAAEGPFLTMPRSCTGPLKTTYEAVSWQAPNAEPDRGSYQAPGMAGCSKLGFSPKVSVKPTTRSAESASGLGFNIDVNDEGLSSPTGLAQSDVKDLAVAMPPGMTLNPSAANGLSVCPRSGYEAESLSSQPGEGCPQASKVGEIEVESPLLAEGQALNGSAFLASQDDNPFGSLVALYVVIKSPELGILVKQAGEVEPSEERGPNAGRVFTFFDGFPQIPFSHLRFRFNEGARAPLVTPPACGDFVTEALFTPWAEPDGLLGANSAFNISSGPGGVPCPAGGVPPFHPAFSAGSLNNSAGAYSPFNMRLTRQDGEQEMTRFDAVLPKGVTGKLAGIAKCPESAIAAAKGKSGRAELASPSCPAASQIGSTLAGAGVGGTLTYVPGKLYLGGPFAGDPLSVIAVTPAVAGPFDVGTIVVHEALNVDPETAEVQVDGARSDPIPHLLKGIPAKVRDLRVFADRPNFTLNPTSCAKKKAKATLFGSFRDVFSPSDDVGVALSDRYQAASCASLKFKPKLSLSLKGGTKRGAHPKLRAVLKTKQGPGSKTPEANIASAVVRLPRSAFLDQAHIGTVCTRVQFAASACPSRSVYGRANVKSPLLEEVLSGPVYLRSSDNELPDLVIALKGPDSLPLEVHLVGRVDSVKGSIRSSFESAPDAAVDTFTLEMFGGSKGLIVNSRNLCARPSRVKVKFTGQNGAIYETQPVLKADCKRGKK